LQRLWGVAAFVASKEQPAYLLNKRQQHNCWDAAKEETNKTFFNYGNARQEDQEKFNDVKSATSLL